MIKPISLVIIIFITGCTTVSTTHRPNDYLRDSSTPEDNDKSLFGGADMILGDADIERILSYRLSLPRQSRIAILRLSNKSNWRYYSSDFTQLNEAVAKDFIGNLKSSSRVYDASFLPSMLIPEQRTVPFLREAAARYQADLLLAYRSKCRTFEKYKLIERNQTKASCSVEAVLLDIRSGIVPFTAVSSNEFSSYKKDDDINFRETIKKAEIEATAKSLKKIANEVNNFLNKIDAK